MSDTNFKEVPSDRATAPVIAWGAQGQMIYERTYSRPKPEPGQNETWPETVERVVNGNLALGDPRFELPTEREDLIRMITRFQLLPAGRHLWASGVPGAQHLMNCWVSGWDGDIEDHFEFTFMRLMEGGGVGANYSNRFLERFPLIQHFLQVEIVCDPGHQDYEAMLEAGVISQRYSSDWNGAFVVEDSREGWAAALVELIQSHYRPDTQNYYRVFDVSNVRPAGSRLKTFGGTASGPLPLAKMLQEVCEVLSFAAQAGSGRLTGLDAMDIDHAIAQCVVAGGVRRSARMAIMHWNDPQIELFIRSKQDPGANWTTNISVEVDDEFWTQVNGGIRSTAKGGDQARSVLNSISEGIYHNGEPGFWDSSLANYGEPNEVIATNPCGEICLCSAEPCNLGHVNLAGFVNEFGGIEYDELEYAHELMTRFLIRATFTEVSDPKSREILDRNRRIGVGHLGVASFLALTGVKFSEAPSSIKIQAMLETLAAIVDEVAVDYSNDLRIPVPVKKRTVAPTGTVSKMPGVSEGIHPIFAKYFIRRIRLSELDPRQVQTAKEYEELGYAVERDLQAANTLVVSMATKDSLLAQVEAIYWPERAEELVQSADELTLEDHLGMQALYQRFWADNAVSYTVNFDPAEYSAEDIRFVLQKFGGILKGTTMFPEMGIPQSPYERITKQQYDEALAKSVADGVDEECANGSCPIR